MQVTKEDVASFIKEGFKSVVDSSSSPLDVKRRRINAPEFALPSIKVNLLAETAWPKPKKVAAAQTAAANGSGDYNRTDMDCRMRPKDATVDPRVGGCITKLSGVLDDIEDDEPEGCHIHGRMQDFCRTYARARQGTRKNLNAKQFTESAYEADPLRDAVFEESTPTEPTINILWTTCEASCQLHKVPTHCMHKLDMLKTLNCHSYG